jgi:hypothetical protein
MTPAATPETTADATDVPDIDSVRPDTASGWSLMKSDPGASVARTLTAGASRSGFAIPSMVMPATVKLATLSSPAPRVPASSMPPAVITNGSFPGGELRTPGPASRLPPAATTAIPCRHRASTAAFNGCWTYRRGSDVPIDRLTTRMFSSAAWSDTHWRPARTVPRSPVPSPSSTLTSTIRAPGAMPT